ncbi:MAG TPA: dTMP kinase [Candidatus Merdibacter merdavium]|uniref:Thymidylate kinase n=1 Tax=Candidatus Merdibacter merdavium TaxID=2838692 RepID=A0A9D2NSA4_9FIRM|nr:dTMP kinase [Candidatus Merdibacter merdavium]
MSRGLFITFEGNDGSGKTTISELVFKQLTQKGFSCILTREPGGIDIAEQIRHIILDPANSAMDARTEALLYAASRRQHLVERVIPALDEGKIVICDRFIDSSLAYQGMGRQIGMEEIFQMNQFATEGLMPDATIFLEVSEAVSRQRLAQRGSLDRMDQESEAFHQRVRRGYALVRQRYSERMRVIDADQELEQVLQAAMRAVMEIVDEHH